MGDFVQQYMRIGGRQREALYLKKDKGYEESSGFCVCVGRAGWVRILL